ncbi:hypothetical protein RJ639_009656, partial [Escallonia herrerae]
MATATSAPERLHSADSSAGGDMKQKDTDPLLSRVSRRRADSKPSAEPPRPRRQQSFKRDFGHAAAETYLITRLTFKLLSYLGLDLYLPKNRDSSKPVVAFVTGGAWIIGYKAWGSLLGQQLAERDIIVACIDYRNFPQGTISDMVKDASEGISFVCNNIIEYGGDPN